MRNTLRFTLGIILLFAFSIYAQQITLSSGKAPFNKANSHINYGTFSLADIAYANDNSQSTNISMPLPAGNPFTVLGSFSAPNFAASMCRGGDGNYYLIDIAPAVYLFDPNTGTCTLIGNITGMSGDQPNGIAYNYMDDTYYMCSSSKFYSLDINTLTATLIGSFTPAITGLMIDLCFDETGTCYSYAVDINPGAANGYIIDLNTAALTTLGYVGFTPNYGQGMSYDYENQVIYLAAFNLDTFTGQLRTMDKATGMTTLVYDWVDQIAPFATNSEGPNPCPEELAPSNPDPPSGTTGVSVDGTTLSWTNGTGTVSVEVWFAGQQVYTGAPITQWPTGALQYFTTYSWKIVCWNDSCSRSATWSFQTEQHLPLPLEDFYPQSAQYWTGTTEGITKTDGEINTVYPNVGWAAYDISTIPQGATILETRFYGYVNAANWPYWSATPMGSVNPVTDGASSINSQILAGYTSDVAYIYSDESSSFTVGWHNYAMGNSALSDLQSAIDSNQGWFAMGFVDRDFTNSFYLNFDGWSQPNPPYIEIIFITPVELTSFRADVNEGNVNLSWQTATETNNKGFEVQRNSGNGFEVLAFVNGNGTSTEVHNYSYIDRPVSGKYIYRLRQVDFDGSSEYSNTIEVNVEIPKIFSLEQNYPNPFNPATEINFSLSEDSKVTLKVFDILGREVAILINGNLTSGEHNVTFNAAGFPSGVYFYRIDANSSEGRSFASVKKMVLTK
ncbi:MAG TPA: T9SS type A sorting domain-containing protein [Ignavibacteriaceae bacterium]|nr:T9SS type A sorting domain-containing protein [Ignavibacteriaceae bacterium]